MPAGDQSRHATDVATSTPTLLSGRYRLDSLIGQGGVGTVWRARDLQLDRDVAVKQLQPGVARDPAAADRFRREATTAASLSHQSLVTIYDVGEDDGAVYLVMELVEGPSLKDVLEAGPLTAGEATALGYRVAAALGAVHGRGLVHRDIKPGNVLLPVDGPPKLVDFGTVHVLGDAEATLTMPGTMLGTIGYVAPEQFEGHEVDPRADVFAVGLLLYECVTGQPAFGTGTIAELTRRRLADDAPAPSQVRDDVPPELDAIVVQATRRDPGQRFVDADALADALGPLVPGDAEARLQALARQHAPDAPDPRPATTDSLPPATTDLDETTVMTRSPDGPLDTSDPTPPVVAPGPVVPPGPEVPTVDRDHEKTSVLPATPTAPADDDADQVDAPSSGGRSWLPLAALVVLAAVVVVLGISALGQGTGSPGDGGTGGGTEGASGSGAASQTVPVADARDHDPLGGGSEHNEDVGLATDGDPATRWDTEGYDSRDFGGLKSGVGIWFRAESEASSVEVDLAPAGADVSLYALDAPPQGGDPSAWGDPIAQQAGAEGTISAEVPEGRNVVLVWFTRTSPNDGNRAGVSEVRFLR